MGLAKPDSRDGNNPLMVLIKPQLGYLSSSRPVALFRAH